MEMFIKDRLGFYNFGESRQLGNPVAFYLFQGLVSLVWSWLSLHYEWNFGLSAGWKPYDSYYNSYNTMIGSKVNAYINANFICAGGCPRGLACFRG